jgi:transcriptional regulator with XRE-family HTH domain
MRCYRLDPIEYRNEETGMELKDRLAGLRRSRGYTLRELRERIERETGEVMAISYLSALERVGRAPSIETLARIAAGYGMTLRELLGPVEIAGGSADPGYSPSFDSFAERRNLDATEKEELWRVQYRGARPETEADWELLYATLNAIDKRRRG